VHDATTYDSDDAMEDAAAKEGKEGLSRYAELWLAARRLLVECASSDAFLVYPPTIIAAATLCLLADVEEAEAASEGPGMLARDAAAFVREYVVQAWESKASEGKLGDDECSPDSIHMHSADSGPQLLGKEPGGPTDAAGVRKSLDECAAQLRMAQEQAARYSSMAAQMDALHESIVHFGRATVS
jgi:hypothetical protein